MEEIQSKEDGNLIFVVNGERFELPSVDPSTTLLEFLRTGTRFKSVKLGCGEGGCGACVVLLSKYDPVLDRVEDYNVSSCLTLLCSVNGCSITTTEGLGNSKDGFHPIHQRFAGFHASQCGFCTPGMCMSLFSALVNAEKTDRPEPSAGFSRLSVSEAEKAVAGNLCRCTGYRPIADACKSFAADVDIEDLGFNSFWKKEESRDVKESRLPSYHPSNQTRTFPDFLKSKTKDSMLLSPKRYSWYSPVTIEELECLLKSEEAENGVRVKLVVSNTGMGYYKEIEPYDKYIDIRHIPELSMTKKDISGIEIGAAVSISKAIAFLREGNGNALNDGTKMMHIKLANHLEKIASGFIRNSASVGGNLVMAQRNHFPSDIATILLAVDAIVDVTYCSKRERIPLEKFLDSPPLDHRSVLLSVNIPNWRADCDDFLGKCSKLMFETYRAAPRPLGNALPYLNAALFAEVITHECSNSITIEKVRLVFGAYGDKHAIRARNAEDFLNGKTLNPDVLYQAMKLVKAIFVPEHDISNVSYRSSLAVAFLFQFLHPGQQFTDGHLSGCVDTLVPQMTDNSTQSVTLDHSSLLLPSKQQIRSSEEYYPVGEALKKTGAAHQASGEAVFVDDIPSPNNCLYGAFIYSTKPLARVMGVGFESDLHPDGVAGIISFNDIPNGGANIGSKSLFGPEPLFADEMTRCAGQRIAVVVADTQKHADAASNLVVVNYDTHDLETPILTVEEAVERGSFFEIPQFICPEPIGDFSKGMAEADHKIYSAEIRLPSQYYFYMETQVALAVPDEDNCMVVYSSVQSPEWTHSVIARCLGIPEHNVRVITRRVGGGFGGKAMRAMPVATACALAAHVLRRPVRMYLDRKTDMIMAGGRHPMKVTFSVGFKSDGKITALHLDVLINAGLSEDISPIIPSNMLGVLKKYDWGALSFNMKVCRTNHTSKSAMRAPGEVQGSFIAEAVIEHVACSLSMEVDAIRNKNLHLFNSLSFFYGDSAGEPHEYTLPLIWDKLAKSSCFNERVELVKQFNSSHKWQKRGISRVPVVHEVLVRPTPGKVSILWDGSIVVEVGGVEIGQGLWTKVKQMAAYSLSLIRCSGSEKLLEKVRVIQADTLSLVQGGFTAGSTTSESSCEATSICCRTLVERLTPLKETLQKQMGAIDWEMLITQAQLQAVNLSASTYYVPDATSMRYLNYGAAVSEVEVNLFTGETKILQSDIIYDCGQSLNPAVDLGQVEGAFAQGIGFFMLEEYSTNSDGLVVANGTWSYKIPTIDTVPKQINVEILNSGHHQKRVLSSKASGEPPLLLACSVHCAARAAIKEARRQLLAWRNSGEVEDTMFQLDVPATMPVVKELCGLDIVETYLEELTGRCY